MKIVFIALTLFSFLHSQEMDKNLKEKLVNQLLFKEYLQGNNKELCQSIISKEVPTYSEFCKGELEENHEKKIIHYSNFIEKNPTIGLKEAYFRRGVSYLVLENNAEAKIDLEKAIELKVDDYYVYYFLGTAERSLKEYTSSINNFSIAISKDSTKYHTYLAHQMRGLSYYNLKLYDKALLDFNQTLSIEPKFLNALVMKIKSYFKLQDNERVKELLIELKQKDKEKEFIEFVDSLENELNN